jgi:hypothetical protein
MLIMLYDLMDISPSVHDMHDTSNDKNVILFLFLTPERLERGDEIDIFSDHVTERFRMHVISTRVLVFLAVFSIAVFYPQRMLTSRPAPLTASRPLHARTPGKALQKSRGTLQENALHGPRTAKSLKVQPQTPSRGEFPITK